MDPQLIETVLVMGLSDPARSSYARTCKYMAVSIYIHRKAHFAGVLAIRALLLGVCTRAPDLWKLSYTYYIHKYVYTDHTHTHISERGRERKRDKDGLSDLKDINTYL